MNKPLHSVLCNEMRRMTESETERECYLTKRRLKEMLKSIIPQVPPHTKVKKREWSFKDKEEKIKIH